MSFFLTYSSPHSFHLYLSLTVKICICTKIILWKSILLWDLTILNMWPVKPAFLSLLNSLHGEACLNFCLHWMQVIDSSIAKIHTTLGPFALCISSLQPCNKMLMQDRKTIISIVGIFIKICIQKWTVHFVHIYEKKVLTKFNVMSISRPT